MEENEGRNHNKRNTIIGIILTLALIGCAYYATSRPVPVAQRPTTTQTNPPPQPKPSLLKVNGTWYEILGNRVFKLTPIVEFTTLKTMHTAIFAYNQTTTTTVVSSCKVLAPVYFDNQTAAYTAFNKQFILYQQEGKNPGTLIQPPEYYVYTQCGDLAIAAFDFEESPMQAMQNGGGFPSLIPSWFTQQYGPPIKITDGNTVYYAISSLYSTCSSTVDCTVGSG